MLIVAVVEFSPFDGLIVEQWIEGVGTQSI